MLRQCLQQPMWGISIRRAILGLRVVLSGVWQYAQSLTFSMFLMLMFECLGGEFDVRYCVKYNSCIVHCGVVICDMKSTSIIQCKLMLLKVNDPRIEIEQQTHTIFDLWHHQCLAKWSRLVKMSPPPILPSLFLWMSCLLTFLLSQTFDEVYCNNGM